MKNRLKEFRKKNRLSQQYLSELLGVSRLTVINIENYKFNPGLELVYKLLTLFNCKFEDLFYRED